MYITKTVTTESGELKLALYKIIGRETPTNEMVDTIDFIGERTKTELESQKQNIEYMLSDVNEKINLFN